MEPVRRHPSSCSTGQNAMLQKDDESGQVTPGKELASLGDDDRQRSQVLGQDPLRLTCSAKKTCMVTQRMLHSSMPKHDL